MVDRNDHIIEVEQLNLFYGDNHILKGVNLGILRHHITAIIGPSGCGKSSFLRCLNRMNDLIPEASVKGSIRFEGKEINTRYVDVVEIRRRIGMVFQKPNPFPKSVYDNVAYGLYVQGIKERKKVNEIVERSLISAGLWDEVKDHLHQSALKLSGGQQQRLCIARVLAIEPDVILLDEPCSALDPFSTFRIEELMVELKARYTLVLVTHNMQQAARVSDYSGFFYLGELVEFAPTRQMFTNPRHKLTENYISGHFG
ncbi:MAG: phosphate ABC transporter ATP-binding protein PstB [bacterium]